MDEPKKRGRKPIDPARKKAAMTIALTPEEREQLLRLADLRGLTASALIAEWIREETQKQYLLSKVVHTGNLKF